MHFLTWLKGLFNNARKVKMEQILGNAIGLQSSGDLSTENSSTTLVDNGAATDPILLGQEQQNTIQSQAIPQPQPLQPVENTVSDLDATLSRVKALLLVADHAVTDVWEDAVAFVKKAIKTEDEVADKLETVLLVAGHDVSDVLKDAFAFAKKY